MKDYIIEYNSISWFSTWYQKKQDILAFHHETLAKL